MMFRAIVNDHTAIFTDDYDQKEIARETHLKHLVRDLIKFDINTPVKVYDANNNFIRYITRDMYTPLELMM